MQHSKPTHAQLLGRFSTHHASGDQLTRMAEVRSALLFAVEQCVAVTPVSPEQSRAVNMVEEATFLFVASIAREGGV